MKIKRLLVATMAITAIATSGTTSAFAKNITVSDTSKDSSVISISNGTAEIISEKRAEFENEHVDGALVSKQVTINTQKVSSDDGTLKIKDKKETSYKGTSSKAIADIKVSVNAPIVYGDANVEIEKGSKTNLDNVNTDYAIIYEYEYNHPFYVKK